MILFGVKSDQPEVEAKWIYFPDKNFLSWSYALVAVSGFLSLFGSMCGFVAAMTARLEDKYGERPNYDGHMLRSQPTVYQDYTIERTPLPVEKGHLSDIHFSSPNALDIFMSYCKW